MMMKIIIIMMMMMMMIIIIIIIIIIIMMIIIIIMMMMMMMLMIIALKCPVREGVFVVVAVVVVVVCLFVCFLFLFCCFLGFFFCRFVFCCWFFWVFFFFFFQSPHCAVNGLHHVHSNGQGAIVRLSRATCCVHMVGRDNLGIKFDRVYITFILALFYWLKSLPMKEWREPEYPEKTPDDELQKVPHSNARKFSSQPRLEPAL